MIQGRKKRVQKWEEVFTKRLNFSLITFPTSYRQYPLPAQGFKLRLLLPG